MLMCLSIQRSAIQLRIVGGRMKQEDGPIKRFTAHKRIYIPLDCSPLNSSLICGHASEAFFWRNATGRNIPRYVVAFPILQQKGSRRDTRIAIHGETVQSELLP